MKGIRIVSDGTSLGTRVYNSDGREIGGVTGIRIEEIKPDGRVRAQLDFVKVELDMVADWRPPRGVTSPDQAWEEGRYRLAVEHTGGRPPPAPPPPPPRQYRAGMVVYTEPYIDPERDRLADRILRRLGFR